MHRRHVVAFAIVAGCARQVPAPVTPPVAVDYAATCRAIAGDIEKLRHRFAQLVEYRADRALRSDCALSYGWRTHRAAHAGGWSASVPNPDPDGIWFYIGIYDPAGPDADLQIHTQPAVVPWRLGDRRVIFLVLEGERVTPAAPELVAILTARGVVTK